jgi:hypothetical protein
MPCGPCPKHGCFPIVGGLGLVARRWCKGTHARVSLAGERGGVDGEYVEKGRAWLVVREV